MRFIDTSWKEHLSVFLRDIPLRGGYTGYNESLGKGRKITGDRGNTRGIAFFPCEFGRNLTFMLPFFPPHLYKASIAASRHWPFRRSFQCSPINGTRSTLRWHRFISLLGQDAQELFREGNWKKSAPLFNGPSPSSKESRFSALCTRFFYRDEIFIFTRLFIFHPESFLNKINKGDATSIFQRLRINSSFSSIQNFIRENYFSFLLFEDKSREVDVLRVEIGEWREQHPAAICAKMPQLVQPLISSLAKSARQSSIKYIIYLKFTPFRL